MECSLNDLVLDIIKGLTKQIFKKAGHLHVNLKVYKQYSSAINFY